MKALIDLYREMDSRCVEFSRDHVGHIPSTSMLPVYPRIEGRDPVEFEVSLQPLSQARLSAALTAGENLLGEISKLDTPGPLYELLQEQFSDYIKEQIFLLKQTYEDPAILVENHLAEIFIYFEEMHRDPQIRDEIICRKIENLPEILNSIKSIMTNPDSNTLRKLRSQVRSGIKFYKYLSNGKILRSYISPGFESRCGAAIDRTVVALESLSGWISNLLTDLPKSTNFLMPVEKYRDLLSDHFGLDLKKLVDNCDDYLAFAQEEVISTASALHVPDAEVKTVNEAKKLLDKYTGTPDSCAEVFSTAEKYNTLIRNEITDHIWLPEEKLIITPLEGLAASYLTVPIGAFYGCGIYVKPLTGKYYINQHSWKEMTDGYLKLMSAHECYFGHHIQYLYHNGAGRSRPYNGVN